MCPGRPWKLRQAVRRKPNLGPPVFTPQLQKAACQEILNGLFEKRNIGAIIQQEFFTLQAGMHFVQIGPFFGPAIPKPLPERTRVHSQELVHEQVRAI